MNCESAFIAKCRAEQNRPPPVSRPDPDQPPARFRSRLANGSGFSLQYRRTRESGRDGMKTDKTTKKTDARFRSRPIPTVPIPIRLVSGRDSVCNSGVIGSRALSGRDGTGRFRPDAQP
jgi:hypothetical protein